ncbi:hypothetical protein KEM60_03036 [Austwickia sp. TVS 96-490-7B]|nr:hypothetical protein [Austwickia sp. TVS 96-490-7B]
MPPLVGKMRSFRRVLIFLPVIFSTIIPATT